MPLFVHLAPAPLAARIRRNGIKPTPVKGHIADHNRCVWAFPVLESFTLTYQWLRELKRTGTRTLVAVTFRIDDAEPVFASHFSRSPVQASAAEAVAVIRSTPDPRGYQVMVPRRIRPAEIVRIRAVPQGIGWRYYPDAKGGTRRPCDCVMCAPRGEVKAKRYRNRIPELGRRWDERRGYK